jgi:hypothetical protein
MGPAESGCIEGSTRLAKENGRRNGNFLEKLQVALPFRQQKLTIRQV